MSMNLQEVWAAIDQLGLALAEGKKLQSLATQKSLKKSYGNTPENEKKAIELRNKLFKILVEKHGDKLKPQARYTIVTKETNERGRHYRKGEFRLFIGEFSTFVIEIGITTDNLDVDPKTLRRVLQVVDDTPFREAKTAEERKNLLKEFVRTQ